MNIGESQGGQVYTSGDRWTSLWCRVGSLIWDASEPVQEGGGRHRGAECTLVDFGMAGQLDRRRVSNDATHARVGALISSHFGDRITLVGPGKDTHGTPVLLRRKAAGGSLTAR